MSIDTGAIVWAYKKLLAFGVANSSYVIRRWFNARIHRAITGEPP